MYFRKSESGMMRSQALNERMSFYDVDLLDVKTFPRSIPSSDMVLIHNVLHYVTNVLAEEVIINKQSAFM